MVGTNSERVMSLQAASTMQKCGALACHVHTVKHGNGFAVVATADRKHGNSKTKTNGNKGNKV